MIDGNPRRDTGLLYELPHDGRPMEILIQRDTNPQAFEKALGREPNDGDIKRGQRSPHSYDCLFCSDCEKMFGQIETQFCQEFLPKIRNHALKSTTPLSFEESDTIRLFILIQFWRSAVSSAELELSDDLKTRIRAIILNYAQGQEINAKEIPISVTYLQTLGDPMEFTANSVGYASGGNPYIVFMGEFILQIYDVESTLENFDYFGVSEAVTLGNHVNKNETQFRIGIIPDEIRRRCIHQLHITKTVPPFRRLIIQHFIKTYIDHCGGFPADDIVERFWNVYLSELTDDLSQYTEEKVHGYIRNYLKRFH